MTEPADKPLSDQEAVFVDCYLASRFNATAAARRAYDCAHDDSARALGYQVKNRPHVAAAIQARLKAHTLGAEEVLSLLSDHARADLSSYFAIEGGAVRFDIAKLKEDGRGHLLKRLKISAEGEVSCEFHDAQAALVQLARVHGLFKDKVEVSGTLGLEDVAGLAAAVRERLKQGGGDG